MAIERTTIDGDIDALKAALETLVPAYFASVTKSTASTTTTISCLDENENVIFSVAQASNTPNATYKVYRDSSNYLSTTALKVAYFYNVGVNGAFLQLRTAGVVAIAKAANGKTAVAIPAVTQKSTSIFAACWGDDTTYDKPLKFADDTNPMTGNNCQFVPVPLYGNYQLSNNIPKVFYMPMAQSNMRGIVQEVTSESGTYITDGYIAMIDDGSEE